MKTPTAKAPLIQYAFLVDIWKGGIMSMSDCFGFATIEECRAFIGRQRKIQDWVIRKRNDEKTGFRIFDESPL